MDSGERLAVLTLDEAHGVIDVLAHVAAGDDEWADDAQRLLCELAARVPSRE